jgi:2-oxoisovalerate dehydrogenase E2 component (dihydrolipoyl transacylase)
MEKEQTAQVGSPLVDIELEGADGPAETPKAASSSSAPVAAVAAATSSTAAATSAAAAGGRVLTSPAVRKMAIEHKVDLSTVPASGKGGRILTKGDMLDFLAGGAKAAPAAAAPAAATAAAAPAAAAKVGQDRKVPLTPIQIAMTKSMNKSLAIPAFGCADEVDITRLTEVRDRMRKVFAARDKTVKLSFMPFFFKAASLALAEYPMINAFTNEACTEVIYKASHNIGFAMDTPKGLLVPNIKNVQAKSLYEIAIDMRDVIARGSKGGLTMDDIQGGTFTLSNIGSIGATYTSPVVFPPQVAIGALGRSRVLPRFDAKGQVYPASVLNVSWSADHRVIDGATMTRFNNAFKQYLEHPELMLADTR